MPARRQIEPEVLSILLLGAVIGGIALTVALDLPAPVAGYLAWPLELPAALAIQRHLNSLRDLGKPAAAGRDRETLAALAVGVVVLAGAAIAVARSGDDEETGARRFGTDPGGSRGRRLGHRGQPECPVGEPARGRQARTARPPHPRAGRSNDPRRPRAAGCGRGGRCRLGCEPDQQHGVADRLAVREADRPADFHGARAVGNLDWPRRRMGLQPGRAHGGEDRSPHRAPGGQAGLRRHRPAGPGSGGGRGLGGRLRRADCRAGWILVRGTHARSPLEGAPADVAAGEGAVWVTRPREGQISVLDSEGRRAGAPIQVGGAPGSVEVGFGWVWVADTSTGTVVRIDPRTRRVAGRPVQVGGALSDIAIGRGAVWALRADGKVRRLRAPSR